MRLEGVVRKCGYTLSHMVSVWWNVEGVWGEGGVWGGGEECGVRGEVWGGVWDEGRGVGRSVG